VFKITYQKLCCWTYRKRTLLAPICPGCRYRFRNRYGSKEHYITITLTAPTTKSLLAFDTIHVSRCSLTVRYVTTNSSYTSRQIQTLLNSSYLTIKQNMLSLFYCKQNKVMNIAKATTAAAFA